MYVGAADPVRAILGRPVRGGPGRDPLAKIHLLPAVLYVMIVKTVAPAWVEAEHTKYLLILAALILYAVLRWALKIIRWRQEERAARGYLLATARPMYEITEDGQYIPIHYDD